MNIEALARPRAGERKILGQCRVQVPESGGLCLISWQALQFVKAIANPTAPELQSQRRGELNARAHLAIGRLSLDSTHNTIFHLDSSHGGLTHCGGYNPTLIGHSWRRGISFPF